MGQTFKKIKNFFCGFKHAWCWLKANLWKIILGIVGAVLLYYGIKWMRIEWAKHELANAVKQETIATYQLQRAKERS